MFKHRLMLSAAVTALLAMPAWADTTISDDETEAVKTSTINDGAPDNIIIDATGSITIKDEGPVVTIDSANKVTLDGALSNKDTSGAQGIFLDASDAPDGGYVVDGDILNMAGSIDLSGTGTGKTGIVISGGQFTGDITLGSGSTVTVVGDGSTGFRLGSDATLVGDLNLGGLIAVKQTKPNETPASSVNGVVIAGTLTGNLNLTNSILVVGNDARGVVVGGTISGTFKNTGNITATGILTPATKTANPESGSAVVVNGSILGGFFNAGPTDVGDTTTAGQIAMGGKGAAIIIAPLATSTEDLTLGSIPLDVDSTNDEGYGFINHGTITASTIDPNINDNMSGIHLGGSSSFKTIVTNGLYNTGVISSTSLSQEGRGVPVQPSNTIGVFIDQNTVIPKLVNQSFSSTGGIISSQVGGPGGGLARGILIASGANPGGTMEIDNLDGAQILAIATSDATSESALASFAIADLSGTVNVIKNTGLISATATALKTGTQITTAIDVHFNSTGVELDNGFGGKAGTITGKVILGSGGDTVTVIGVSPTAQSSITGGILFGSGAADHHDFLSVSNFATVSGSLISDNGLFDVEVGSGGVLSIDNTKVTGDITNTMAQNFHVAGNGELDLKIIQSQAGGAVQAGQAITLDTGAKLNVTFGSFIGASEPFIILDAPTDQLTIKDAADYIRDFTTPFLFNGGLCLRNVDAAHGGTATSECTDSRVDSSHSQLVLTLQPKSVAELGLTGYAAQMYPIANQVLPLDNVLGAAIVSGVTDNESAQKTYDAFAPVVNGGVRALAVAFTDQTTGAIGARQRILRTYGKQPGESTLWGIEYAQFLDDPGQDLAGGGRLPGYKDHGFGFSLGADGGSPENGWYGGAFSFYTGDVGEVGNRLGQAQSEWYMASGYTDWRGRGLFLDSNVSTGIANLKSKRIISIGGVNRIADSKHIGVFLSGGVTTGAILKYAGTSITPQLSIDGLTMRENGYQEHGGGSGSAATDGFDLNVGSSNTSSLRAFLGADLRQDIDVGDFYLQPEGRAGYRYDFISDPQKVRANFIALPGTNFTVAGPDPAQGNFVAGASLSASTDTWSIGVSYDYVRGTNGVTQQTGEFTLVGRI